VALVRSIALSGIFKFFAYIHPQTTFSLNDPHHTKTPKLTKTSEKNNAKSLTNISWAKINNIGTHQIPSNLHFASSLAKLNEKHIKTRNISLLSWEKRLHLAYAISLLNP
jgi:hypothetical protein